MSKDIIHLFNDLAVKGISANGTFGANGQVLTSNGSIVYWGVGGGSSQINVGETPPGDPVAGDLWWNSATASLFVYYTDQDGSQWVEATTPGPQGYTGSQGSLGYTGSIGFTGSTGFTGSQGVIGYTGSQGDIGYTGSQGVIGFTGSQGVIGYTGSKGDIGYTGSQGDIGFTGSKGDIGFTGSTGFTGSQGDTGFTGSGAPIGGSNTNVLFNDSTFANGTSNFTFNKATNILYVANSVGIGSTPTYSLTVGNSTVPTNITVLNALVTTETAVGVSALFRKSVDATQGPNIGWAKSRGTAASPTAVNSGDTSGALTFYGYGGTNYRPVVQITAGTETYTSDTNLTGVLTFAINSGTTTVTERMRLTANGHLGLGAIPSAWSGLGGGGVIQWHSGALLSTPGGGIDTSSFATNVYYDGTNWIYRATSAAARYDHWVGIHRWFTAPSGTTGTNASFTQTMTLSSAGGLSVGTTTDPGTGKILAAKGILPRVNAQTTTTSPWAWNSDDYDQQSFSALANALTINADAGTPTDGQRTILRFKDNATTRTLTFTGGTSKGFRDLTGILTVSGSNFTYPTAVSKTVYFGCVYNTADSRWDIIAVTQEP
jgi:hypothetical protein